MQKLQLFRFLSQRRGVAEKCNKPLVWLDLVKENEPEPPEQTGRRKNAADTLLKVSATTGKMLEQIRKINKS